ncbi:MAG: Gfo/Idh/MocA family oxidoreductase, partial [Planctomycetales bacterium]|nr:Gfo/Idh/MocA family oxidoreductase [Planctomycetales bacterium]
MYRRTFLTGVAMAAAAVPASRMARAAKANDRIRVGLIGCGGRGRGVAAGFAGLKEVEVAAVCDPDSGHAASTSQLLPNKPPVQADMRRLLDDKSIDAVIVATPDHWHAPAAILAAEAGKHVYVEKPCSHNVREGRLLV